MRRMQKAADFGVTVRELEDYRANVAQGKAVAKPISAEALAFFEGYDLSDVDDDVLASFVNAPPSRPRKRAQRRPRAKRRSSFFEDQVVYDTLQQVLQEATLASIESVRREEEAHRRRAKRRHRHQAFLKRYAKEMSRSAKDLQAAVEDNMRNLLAAMKEMQQSIPERHVQSCRIDLHCRDLVPGGALSPALPDLGIDVTVRTAQPPTTSQACIKVGAALRRAEKEKRDYYTGFNHGKTLIVPAAMTTTGGFASSFVDLLGQLARCAEARGVYQPGLDEAFVPRWKGRFAALVHQMNADHIQRHFGGVCLWGSLCAPVAP
ncbi:uncharacterized protein MONBRDRAFT_28605 [Monosiga brevicollis MX1]|uniref:Uncharacterized protein n=1 Tax=Monosiga brevicollis TaxID=81824 RepID=A9V8N5_MONBE|nr:uncharacterized protein MONBRDRAFT_28605 [Monosiga brevicollis MX1]EDQ86116.1 predicted protein [Monosiga brevicollis MX1]|eukprot:XP_001749041.1 hypothetical protein [Monosiga brevicollis MX1]